MNKVCLFCLEKIKSSTDIYLKNNNIFHINCYDNMVIKKTLRLANQIKSMDTIDIINNILLNDKLNISEISNTDKVIIKKYYEENKSSSFENINLELNKLESNNIKLINNINLNFSNNDIPLQSTNELTIESINNIQDFTNNLINKLSNKMINIQFSVISSQDDTNIYVNTKSDAKSDAESDVESDADSN